MLFVAHGSPLLALAPDHAWAQALRGYGATLAQRSKAVLAISAHWRTDQLFVTGAERPGVLHDFGGFPEALYTLDYPAPGHPDLARRVADLVGAEVDSRRPWDHGVWMVLRHLWPGADLPVVQLSLPRWSPAELLHLGERLASLRAEGVLVVGSGGLVHNLARARFHEEAAPVEPWALAAEGWFMERLERGETETLLTYRKEAPQGRAAAPTSEHLDPLFVVLGAARGERPRTLFDGWQHGNISLRTLAWEAP